MGVVVDLDGNIWRDPGDGGGGGREEEREVGWDCRCERKSFEGAGNVCGWEEKRSIA
jgi:hypothetical protein